MRTDPDRYCPDCGGELLYVADEPWHPWRCPGCHRWFLSAEIERAES